jgi:molecular chaperone GrpE (heat shock protein)
VEQLMKAVDAVARIEAAVQPLVGMLQATAKSGARSDQDRKQQLLELRAHITGETDRLAETLRAQITREAAVEVWRALVPAIDEIDHVLREAPARGLESLRLVRRKLRDAMSRLEIEEISVEERITQFDPELHEGKPHDGDGDDAAGLAAGTVVRLERTGYAAGDRVLRCAQVTVVNGQRGGS